MPNHRNTGLLGIVQNYNDTMSQLDAQRGGGLSGLIDERNRLAVRDAHLDTADHLAALREQQERAERRARQEQQRQERERKRIADLPKCTDCESPVEGTPNRCPRCNEVGILAASQFHAAPQLRPWLSNPERWPVLYSLGITTDDVNQLKSEGASLILQLRKTRAYRTAPRIRNSLDVHELIEREASDIDAVESSIQVSASKKNSTLERQYIDCHPHSDPKIMRELAACAVAVIVPIALPAQYGWLGVATLVGGLTVALISLIMWNARVQDHRNAFLSKYRSTIDNEIAGLQKTKARLMAESPGLCFRLRELTMDANKKAQANDSLREQWVRLCESSNCDLPTHIGANSTGPSPISAPLAQLFDLFQPEATPPSEKARADERSAAKEDVTASVVRILVRCLIAVAVADGRIQAEEVAAITNELIGVGTEDGLARSVVKQCITELKSGTSRLDFIKLAISTAARFKGTSFGRDILDMQCAVAKSDGVVSANEHKVLDAFQKGLG